MLRRTLFGIVGTTVLVACDRAERSLPSASSGALPAALIAPNAPVDPAFTGCTA